MRDFRLSDSDFDTNTAEIGNCHDSGVTRSTAGRGRRNERAGIGPAFGDDASERSGDFREAEQRLDSLQVRLGDFIFATRSVQGLRNYEVGRSFLRVGHALEFDSGEFEFGC